MKHRVSFFSLVLFTYLTVGSSCFSNIATPEMLANTCAGCHGPNGVSSGPAIPTIAGIDIDYFVAAMQGYKSGEWSSTVMQRLAKSYSYDEIKAMGIFFSRQKFVPAIQKVDNTKAKLGELLHKQYCEKCHENNGSSNEGTGILSGQWMPYIQATINDYIAGKRPIDRKMKTGINTILSEHTGTGIEALIHFYGRKKQ